MKRTRIPPNKTKPLAKSRELAPLGAADYDTVRARHVADLKPGSIVEQKYVEAMADDMWGELHLRRSMSEVINNTCADALAAALTDLIDQPPVSDEDELEKIAEYEAQLAEAEADLRDRGRTQLGVVAIKGALEQAKRELDEKRSAARQAQVEELMRDWRKRDPAVVKRIKEMLANAGKTIESVVVPAMVDDPTIKDMREAIGELAGAYNASLEHLARYRTVLRPALEGKQKHIEGVDYHDIKPKNGKPSDDDGA